MAEGDKFLGDKDPGSTLQSVPRRGEEMFWPSCCTSVVEFGSVAASLGGQAGVVLARVDCRILLVE